MRIVVDLQGAQTTRNRNRGIGRYTLRLALAMARQAGTHELFIALNHAFPETIEPIRGQFECLIPAEHLLVWRTPGPVSAYDGANQFRTAAGELLREHALQSLRPDVIHVSSLFEGISDDAVTSVKRFNTDIPTAVTLNGLAPHLSSNPYPGKAAIERWCQDKLRSLRAADLLLAISEYSRAEAVRELHLEMDRIVLVAPDADPRFRRIALPSDADCALRQRYGLRHNFLMSMGVLEYRKDGEALVEAFARLPYEIVAERQLIIVGQINEDDRAHFLDLGRRAGLGREQLILAGFVSDEDLLGLYNLCELFIFSPMHERFALPVLEAMRCGAPVIGSNGGSTPEVIGLQEALFDPTSIESIASKLVQSLANDAFRQSLREHCMVQAKRFSWDASARRAFSAFEALYEDRRCHGVRPPAYTAEKPRLAYFSPLPPERSGIADYSAELLPELLRHYRIELITDLERFDDSDLATRIPRRSIAYFEAHAEEYDRILYNFGNSEFHWQMFSLLDRFSGTVVLHDFYLSGALHWLEATGKEPCAFRRALYRSHGYRALRVLQTEGVEAAVWAYPCSRDILENAQGVIVHSRYARTLAEQHYGWSDIANWAQIPQLRRLPSSALDRSQARRVLGLPEDAFIVASFGMVGPTKLCHRLVSAWLRSRLIERKECRLLFVGHRPGEGYNRTLGQQIKTSGYRHRIMVTGHVSPEDYYLYLHAADAAVQLRTRSRGETSRAILDCLAHGLPTVVNGVGAATELPDEAVIKLAEEFTDNELASALAQLAEDPDRRRTLGERAQDYISRDHNPVRVAQRFVDAIEYFASNHPHQAERRLAHKLVTANGEGENSPADLADLATAIAENERRPDPRQLFVDVSLIAQNDLLTGIQRVTRNILRVLLENPPAGYRVEPVRCARSGDHFRYARAFTLRFLGLKESGLEDAPIDISPGDVFLGLDWYPTMPNQAFAYLRSHRLRGLGVYFVVYDLLPLQHPQWFPAEVVFGFENWLSGVVSVAHGIACISRTVADDLADWLIESGETRQFHLGFFHLGADIDEGRPSNGLTKAEVAQLARLDGRKALLMVGTVEPRKGYAQVLDAMNILWASGQDIALAIVGKQGWMVEKLAQRLRKHPERNKRLFWFEHASDGLLNRLYERACALVMASEGEGFGLPLIEAAQYRVPIIARDIAVFREVAGDHAVYFRDASAEGLAAVLTEWLTVYRQGNVSDTAGMPRLSWVESTRQLLDAVLGGQWYRSINLVATAGREYSLGRQAISFESAK